MERNERNTTSNTYFWKPMFFLILACCLTACSSDTDLETLENEEDATEDEVVTDPTQPFNADINGDGELNVLILGTSKSIHSSAESFAPGTIATELNNILTEDATNTATVYVEAEDIYKSKEVTVGLGSGGTEYAYMHYCHSLVQYYYWPENMEARMDKLSGKGAKKWDYVVIAADPYMVSNLPGYYSLGVNKIAAKVVEGGAKPLLMMMWPKAQTSLSSIAHFEEYTYRAAAGAAVELETIPAGLAWQTLANDKKDESTAHPSPNGAYTAAATIYAQIYGKSAAESTYDYDNTIAETAFAIVKSAATENHFSGVRTHVSPFLACDISDAAIHYNHTGTSTERGILAGLNWVFGKSDKTLAADGPSPINFNFGRANTNFEADKRYRIDASAFDFSFGFPMQDGSNTGDVSQLYGIDKRNSQSENGTDLGVALYMVREAELPYARAVPIRTLYAQLKEMNIATSAYRDNWHLSRDLDKAIAGYMYTLLTGSCDLGEEPADTASAEWKSWASHKIGYETAWNLMYLDGKAPSCP
ncbi:hypothetical protein N9954_03410 [Maribacter sp.]|nr:hypothetical protein [Maribacter sp.]